MSIVSGFESITCIMDSDQISSALHATKPLTQYIKKDTSEISPDWTVAANQPIIYVRAKSQLQMARKTIVSGTEKWFYNDYNNEIKFDASGNSTNYPSLFKKVSHDDGGVSVPGLLIIGNLASTTNTDSDRICFSGQVEIGNIKTDIYPEIDIRLEETVGDPYEGYIDASEGGVIDDDTDEVVCTAILYKGGAIVTSGLAYQWFKQEEGEWKLLQADSGKPAQVTIREEDINSELVIKCDFFYGGTKVFTATRQLSDETDPLIISSNPSGSTQLRSGETVSFTPKVIRRSNAEEVTGYTFSYALYNTSDTKIRENTGTSITIDYATVLANSSIKLYINAKK